MGNIDKSKLTEVQIQKAMACSSVEELMKVAKEEGYELTEDEAKAYLEGRGIDATLVVFCRDGGL